MAKWIDYRLDERRALIAKVAQAKNGAPSAAAPKIFFCYYYVNSSTGEKSGVMLAETTWTAGT